MSIRTSINVVCVALLPGIAGGCGVLFTHGPPTAHEQFSSFSCTESNVGPILDVLWGSWSTYATLALVSKDRDPGSHFTYAALSDGAVAIYSVWAVVSGAAAFTGFRKTKRCRDAKRALEVRRAQLRDVGLEPPASSAVVLTVVVGPSVDTLSIGEQVQLVATATTSNGSAVSNVMFVWSSSNDTIASVHTGLVTAHASGAVVIAANTDNGVGTASIVVLPQS